MQAVPNNRCPIAGLVAVNDGIQAGSNVNARVGPLLRPYQTSCQSLFSLTQDQELNAAASQLFAEDPRRDDPGII